MLDPSVEHTLQQIADMHHVEITVTRPGIRPDKWMHRFTPPVPPQHQHNDAPQVRVRSANCPRFGGLRQNGTSSQLPRGWWRDPNEDRGYTIRLRPPMSAEAVARMVELRARGLGFGRIARTIG